MEQITKIFDISRVVTVNLAKKKKKIKKNKVNEWRFLPASFRWCWCTLERIEPFQGCLHNNLCSINSRRWKWFVLMSSLVLSPSFYLSIPGYGRDRRAVGHDFRKKKVDISRPKSWHGFTYILSIWFIAHGLYNTLVRYIIGHKRLKSEAILLQKCCYD